MSEQNFGLGKGITITTGFDLAAQLPLDSRTVVHDMDQLRALPADRIYLGLLVFVISENKLYQWKYNLDNNGNLSKEPDWGPIEAEVSTKEIKQLSEIDFKNTPSLQLQKNKSDFFPIVHEKYVYDDGAINLPEKYQTKVDSSLATTNKSVSGAINEVNTKMTDSIKQFEEQIQETLDNLTNQVNGMLEETNNKITAAETKINNAVTKMETDIADAKKELNKSSMS